MGGVEVKGGGKTPHCFFLPKNGDSCRRVACKEFEVCPGGRKALRPGDEKIGPPLDDPSGRKSGLEGHGGREFGN